MWSHSSKAAPTGESWALFLYPHRRRQHTVHEASCSGAILEPLSGTACVARPRGLREPLNIGANRIIL